ncbi:MAG: sugar phosphate isomerase/epimerase [Planctomycetes bacterium]|nr:sugar phosphate isomerase/epimerase [Planctomycetota bacterium]
MRLGGPVLDKPADPEAWVQSHLRQGYSAAYAPNLDAAAPDVVRAYRETAAKHNLLIAEVGAWSNPISPDNEKRTAGLAICKKRLAIADELGARSCVNIVGSRNPAKWDGPHPENLTEATFDMIVQCVREIVDAVKPTRTFYTLETMPWIWPDSPDAYLRLLKAIDRTRVAVHLDPVNMVNCPSRAYDTGGFIRDCFAKLGPYIKSCHGKDIVLHPKLTVHLDECRPGTGVLDYAAFLRELGRLDPDTPLMLEHLPPEESEYRAAADHVRAVAAREGVTIR